MKPTKQYNIHLYSVCHKSTISWNFLCFDSTRGNILTPCEDSRTHSRHSTLGNILLDERSARRKGLYLTTHNDDKIDIHAPGWIRTPSSSKRKAADPRLRLRCHWDRQLVRMKYNNSSIIRFSYVRPHV